jgi:hypothetical protein
MGVTTLSRLKWKEKPGPFEEAHIHPCLKVKIGFLRIDERDRVLTDNGNDGGVGGYGTGKERRTIYVSDQNWESLRTIRIDHAKITRSEIALWCAWEHFC